MILRPPTDEEFALLPLTTHQLLRVRKYFDLFQRELDEQAYIFLKCGFALNEIHYDIRVKPEVSVAVVPIKCIQA